MAEYQDPMTARAADSAAMLPYWQMVDDIVTGADAVRGQADTYLPKFPAEMPDDYNFRLKLAKFTNVYRDIVEGLASKPFQEEMALADSDDVTIPPEFEQFVEDVDGSGNNLTMFGAQTFFNGINSSVDWIFVDYSNMDDQPPRRRTKAEERRMGLRPFWSRVMAKNVLEVRSEMINGKEEWTYFRIFEPGSGGPDHVRVMERDGSSARWELFEDRPDAPIPGNGKTRYVSIGSGVISIGVLPMVPFITGRRDGRRYFFYPPMRDAADLQINLYRDETNLQYAKTMTAFPMVVGNGVKPDKKPDGSPVPIQKGPNCVLYAPTDGSGSHGEWTIIEPSSQSLTFLANDITSTIQQLRELGRQPLTAQSGQLTVITTAVAASKAKSAVAAWALALKDAIENALVLTGMWMSIGQDVYDPEVSIYTEFDEFGDTGPELDTLTKMRETGDLSQETLWSEMKRRRVLSADFDADQEIERLLDETPGEDDGIPSPVPEITPGPSR